MSEEKKNNETILDDEEEIITMTYEDGSEEDFELLAELDYEDKWYAYVRPVQPDEDFADDEVLVLEIADDENGEEIYLPVTDDKLLDALIDMFNRELEKFDE